MSVFVHAVVECPLTAGTAEGQTFLYHTIDYIDCLFLFPFSFLSWQTLGGIASPPPPSSLRR